MTATIASSLTIGHSGIIVRPLIGFVIGLTVTTSLFWAMQYLIENADPQLNLKATYAQLEFVRIKRDEEIVPDRRKIEKPPIPEPQPVQLRPDLFETAANANNILLAEVPVDPPIKLDKLFGNGVGEGDYLPIVKVAPIYPQRALSRGIEGYCVVEYTVTRQGFIRDPVVIESLCTSSLFHRASVDAARKFKYKPRVINGEAIEVSGVQNKFTYRILD